MGLFNVGNIISSDAGRGIIEKFEKLFPASYQNGGIIVHKNPKFINDEELKQYIKNSHSYASASAGGRLVGAPYQMGGGIFPTVNRGIVPFIGTETYKEGGIVSGIGSVLPSTILSPFNQIGNIVRPNSLQINRSRQAIINKNLI